MSAKNRRTNSPAFFDVAQVPHRHDQRVVDDPGDDRPLDVFELQEEVGDVGDEVLARQRAEERAEDLIDERAALVRLEHVVEPLERDFRAFHLADQRRVGERIEIRERLEVDAVGLSG